MRTHIVLIGFLFQEEPKKSRCDLRIEFAAAVSHFWSMANCLFFPQTVEIAVFSGGYLGGVNLEDRFGRSAGF